MTWEAAHAERAQWRSLPPTGSRVTVGEIREVPRLSIAPRTDHALGEAATPLDRTALDGYTGTTPLQRLTVELNVRDRRKGLEDQCLLTMVLGLDAPPPAPRVEPPPVVHVDAYRRGRRGRAR